MLVEFVVIVVLCLDSFFRDHHTKQDTFILLQSIPLLQILIGKIADELESNRDIGSLEHLNDTPYP